MPGSPPSPAPVPPPSVPPGSGPVSTLSATVGLTVTGRLEGASLLPSGGAVTEAVVLSLADGLVGLVLTRGRRDPR